jgi:hypothetical protein
VRDIILSHPNWQHYTSQQEANRSQDKPQFENTSLCT